MGDQWESGGSVWPPSSRSIASLPRQTFKPDLIKILKTCRPRLAFGRLAPFFSRPALIENQNLPESIHIEKPVTNMSEKLEV